MPGTCLTTLHVPTHLIFSTALCGRYYHHPLLIDEEFKAQKCYEISLSVYLSRKRYWDLNLDWFQSPLNLDAELCLWATKNGTGNESWYVGDTHLCLHHRLTQVTIPWKPVCLFPWSIPKRRFLFLSPSVKLWHLNHLKHLTFPYNSF